LTPAFRLAAAADLPALHALIERGYRGDAARAGWTHEADLIQGQRTDQATLAAILADPRQRLLLMEDEGVLVGCVNLADLGGGLAYLGLLCIDPNQQAGGFGKMLISEAEDMASSSFCASRIEMTVIERRSELIAYYQRRGYRLTGEKRPFPLPADFEMVVLEKPIARS
jgi:GNAT superfamily N-acetyltransferase